jgi:hypothetical protein
LAIFKRLNIGTSSPIFQAISSFKLIFSEVLAMPLSFPTRGTARACEDRTSGKTQLRLLAAAAILLLAASALTRAQEVTGTILGVITDSTGAVVPNAKVTITNVDRHAVERIVKTSPAGEYSAPQLPIGRYSVTVEAPNFKKVNETGIVLNVNDHRTLNEALQVGNISETVSVQANNLQVDTQSAAATGLITGTQVRELALQSRNYEELVALMPGVSSDLGGDFLYAGVSAPSGATNETAFSLNGSFGTGNNWTVDGADNVDRGGNFTLLNYPSVDAIEEFKVLRGNYNAEYGRSSGGIINVITRSGTSKFHGGVYEFFRNDVLDANTWEDKHFSTPAVPRQPLRYNDFGGTFGGPIFIPGHYNVDRSKTFFFFSEEARRVVQSGSATSIVPDAGMRATNPTFPYPVCMVPLQSDGTCPAGSSGTTIPQAMVNPAAAAYLKDVYSNVPLPQDTSIDQLVANQANIFNYRQEIGRLDHTFNSKWSGWLRIMNDTIPTQEGGGLFNGNAIPNIATTSTQSPGKNIAASLNTTFTSTLLNQLEYAWSFGAVLSTNIGALAASNSPDVASAITLPYTETLDRIPSIAFGNGSASFYGFGSYRDYNKNHNVFDNLTWIVGRHSLKFGATYYHYQKSENSGGNNAGTFTFQVTPDPTLAALDPDPTGGDAEWRQEFAYFLLGQSTNFTQLQQDIRAIIDQNEFETYAQDEFRIRPNLTLTYGLRYSLFRQPTDAKGHATSFDPGAYNSANAPVLDDQGYLCTPQTMPCSGTSNTNPNYNPLNGIIIGGNGSPFGTAVAKQTTLNFAPRLGFAWDPTGVGKMSVRGGYGIFVESPGIGFVENNVFANPPFVGTTTIYSAAFNDPGSTQAAPNNNPPPIGGTEPNFRQPYMQSWNLDIQRQLPFDIIGDIGYYGSKGTHLLAVADINQPIPGAYASVYGAGSINSGNENLINGLRPYIGYAGIDEYEPIFISNYNSLQASIQKRFSADSLLTVNYTWSKNLSNVPYDPNYTVVQDTRNLAAEYSYARFDQRNVFNADFVYQLPFFKNQQGMTGRALGGWEFSGIIAASSGHWLDPSISDGQDPGGIGLNTGVDGNTVRPDQVGNPNKGVHRGSEQWFNTAAFVAPASFNPNQTTAGDAKKNSILGPGEQRWDLSLLKNIKVYESSSLQFRVETFNAFNHTSYAGIDTNVSDSTYGIVTSAHEPRIMQLGLKFNF